jgi:hypothetical protein
MEYSKLVGVTGLSGLFELISSKADGGIVRSLEDKTTKFVSNRMHSFSHLESIEVYTTGENVNLLEVFTAMKASSEALPNVGQTAELKAYFSKVYPNMDFERVYVSDMKKMVKWYEQLTKNNIELKHSENNTEEESVEVPVEKKSAPKATAAPAKAAAVKNAPAKKVNAPRKMA